MHCAHSPSSLSQDLNYSSHHRHSMKRSADALFSPEAAPSPPQTRFRGTCRSASVLSALPADILRISFSYFPQRHRLRVLSLVNKRWRGIALSTITSLDGLASERALDLLPALTHLTVGPRFALDSVPTTLKSLTLSASGLDGVHCLVAQPGSHRCPVSAYLPLTSLTTLHFDLSTGIMRQCVVQLVSACAPTLRSLTLRVDMCNSKHSLSFGGALNALTLPSLTEVDSNLSHDDLEPLLRQHASQLRSLRLATRPLDRLLRDYPNPNPNPRTPSRAPPLRLLDLFASHNGVAAQMVPIDLSDPDWLAHYVSQANTDKQSVSSWAPRALAAQVMSSLMQLPSKLPPSVETVLLQIAPGCPALTGGPCLTLLEGLLSLPNLRCIDLRRCTETQPISERPFRRWRTFLRLAATHPKLERLWLPPGLFTEETYAKARRDVPDTQLCREMY